MSRLTQVVVGFVKGEEGPTAVEYAVMLALIIVVCIGAITTLGGNANQTFTSVGNAISGGDTLAAGVKRIFVLDVSPLFNRRLNAPCGRAARHLRGGVTSRCAMYYSVIHLLGEQRAVPKEHSGEDSN